MTLSLGRQHCHEMKTITTTLNVEKVSHRIRRQTGDIANEASKEPERWMAPPTSLLLSALKRATLESQTKVH